MAFKFNAFTHKLDITGTSSSPVTPTTFNTDSGSAVPASDNLNIVTLANDGIITSGAGDTITITSANDLAAIEALASTGYAVRTGVETWELRTFQEGTGIDLTNPAGTAGDTTISVDTSELTNLATTYTANVGNATPALNVIRIFGGTGVTTTASGNTVTIDASSSAPTSFPTDSGTATPAANSLSIVTLANDGIATSGAGDTVTITSANDLAAIEALATTGYAVRTGAETWALRTFQEGTGIDLTNPAGTAGDTTIAVDITELTTVPTTFNGDSGSASAAANIITIAGGPGITTSASGSTVTINSVVFTDQTATTLTSDSGTFATAAGAYVLPASPAQGDLIEIVALAAGVIVTGNTGQEISIGTDVSSTAGTATSTDVGDSLKLRYRSSDTRWYAVSGIGLWTLA